MSGTDKVLLGNGQRSSAVAPQIRNPKIEEKSTRKLGVPGVGELQIGQVNAGRARLAMDELRREAELRGLDVLLIQEPYVRKGRVEGFGRGDNVLVDDRSERPLAAIVVLNAELVTFKYCDLCDDCSVVVWVEPNLLVVSGYFKYSDPTAEHIGRLERIKRRVVERWGQVIVGADVNAKSELWFSGRTDEKGLSVEEFIGANDLYVLNRMSNLTTFENGRFATNIDVSLGGGGICRCVRDWRILDVVIGSDHRLITYGVIGSPFNSSSVKKRKKKVC
ncbi:uncharacterized protein [Rhodnius prolixus]|uniref:uncharacterized protein n=1 Tax=Rhodnius prolixus TaxID=13249 RepID=UPI003D18D9FD